MAQGGKRKGAGRPKGARNVKTKQQVKAVEEGGITPLEYMLSTLRDETRTHEDRMDAASKAAPYVHSRLNAVDHSSTDGTMTPPDAVGIYQLPDNGR